MIPLDRRYIDTSLYEVYKSVFPEAKEFWQLNFQQQRFFSELVDIVNACCPREEDDEQDEMDLDD